MSAQPPSLFDALAQAARMMDAARLEIAMNPGDVTDEVRAEVARLPLVTLRETGIVERGKAYVIRPGALGGDLDG